MYEFEYPLLSMSITRIVSRYIPQKDCFFAVFLEFVEYGESSK